MPAKRAMPYLPVAALLFGASCWGVFWYPLRLFEANGLSGLWSTAIIYGTALLIGLPAAWRNRRAFHEPAELAWLACASGWCNVAFILAVLEGNVIRVLLLFYLSPLWTVILGKALLREVLTSTALATLVLAMAGALIMLWDPAAGRLWPQGTADWLALSSGFAFALSNVLVRRLQAASVVVKGIVAWAGVVALAVLGIGAGGLPAPQIAPGVLYAALALGGGMIFMTVAVLYGVTHMPAYRSATLLLFELVAGAASALWLTDEIVAPNEWVGGGFIVAAAWLAAHAHAREPAG